MAQYSTPEVAKMLQITGAGVRLIIKEKKLVDGKNIIKMSMGYVINDKGVEIIKSYSRKGKRGIL